MSSNSTDLVRNSTIDGKTATIPTLQDTPGGYTTSAFENCTTSDCTNKWGYKKDQGNYLPFTTNTTILSNNTSTNNDTTTLNFASKIDYNQIAGTYNTTLTFSAVANPLVTYLQELDSSLCTTTPTAAIDRRDGEEYLIQKLADGNCWMIDNLRLDPTQVELAKLKGDTNATDQILEYFKNGGGSSPYPASGVSSAWTSASQNSYVLPYVATGYKDTIDSNASKNYGDGSHKYGVYYNYCAASAGSYCYTSTTGTGNTQYDICPKGWRLPTGGDNGEFKNLTNIYSSTTPTNTNSPQYNLSTPLAGYFNGGGPINQGSYGYFWSSTRYAAGMMNSFYATTSAWSAIHNYYRDGGFSIRCILRDDRTLSDIANMQDVGPQVAFNTADGTTKALRDLRDNNTYTVAKINGKLWMAQNLRFTGTSLNSTTSNVEDIYTPTSPYYINPQDTPQGEWKDLTLGNDYTQARYHIGTDGNGNPTVWYNFAGASAGTITGSSNTNATTYDICPKGWRLIAQTDISSITGYKDAFTPTTGGWYVGGSASQVTNGYWWTSTSVNANYRWYLVYNGTALSQSNYMRDAGMYVRCVAK